MKSFPTIEIKCNECGAEVTVPIKYESESERWKASARPDAAAWIDTRHEGWRIREGNDTPDLCPECDKKFESSD